VRRSLSIPAIFLVLIALAWPSRSQQESDPYATQKSPSDPCASATTDEARTACWKDLARRADFFAIPTPAKRARSVATKTATTARSIALIKPSLASMPTTTRFRKLFAPISPKAKPLRGTMQRYSPSFNRSSAHGPLIAKPSAKLKPSPTMAVRSPSRFAPDANAQNPTSASKNYESPTPAICLRNKRFVAAHKRRRRGLCVPTYVSGRDRT
jgi:hypothetical protein